MDKEKTDQEIEQEGKDFVEKDDEERAKRFEDDNVDFWNIIELPESTEENSEEDA